MVQIWVQELTFFQVKEKLIKKIFGAASFVKRKFAIGIAFPYFYVQKANNNKTM